jgi:TDG/mug DNA glycosylase family protein
MIKYHIQKNAKILFVGINPHFGSYSRGVPFSNNKMFWYLLSDSGIIKEKREYLKDDKKLKKLYNQIGKKYKINFINIIDRPSRDVSDLRKGEEEKGVKRLNNIIKNSKPKIVCFIGKVTFAAFMGEKKINFGLQENIKDSKVYVMHFPVRGYANVRIRELKEILMLAKGV